MYRYLKYLLLSSGLFILHAAGAQTSTEKIDVRRIVLEHIGDAYEWHIGGNMSIPLTVIVCDERGEWHVFSSERLRDGARYAGFRIATEGDNAGKIVDEEGNRPLDLSLTKTTTALLLNSALVLLLVLSSARWYRRHGSGAVPRGFVGAIETLVTTVYDDVICSCAGCRTRRFAPLLLTLFFFILVNNLMGLFPVFPGGAGVTGSLSVTLVLAVVTFLAVNLFGTRSYWREIFRPDVPAWLKAPVPLMPLVELVGVVTKPFALMIRLAANMIAGHAVIAALACLIFLTAKMGAVVNGSMTVVAVLFGVFMNLLELLVAFIQAYVFTMLSALFIGMASPEHKNDVELK